jgi:hypothetical protein
MLAEVPKWKSARNTSRVICSAAQVSLAVPAENTAAT